MRRICSLFDRHWIALLLSVAIVATLAAGTGTALATDSTTPVATPSPMAGMSMGGEGDDQHMVMTSLTGKPTAQDEATADAVLAKTKAATAKYQDINVAKADGYTLSTRRVAPGVGIHLTNPKYWAAAVAGNFDPTKPPSLLYNQVNGSWKLVGVMYVAPTSDTQQDLAKILPSTLAAWHQHLDLCIGAGGVPRPRLKTAAACTAAGGTFWDHSPWMVHAWIWQANPDGMFAYQNPTVRPS